MNVTPMFPVAGSAPRRSRRAGFLAAAVGLMLTAAAGAQVPLITVEESLETGTELVRLPGTPEGTLSASTCSACAKLRLRFDARTEYFIGREPVPYKQFREAAATGPLALYVFYRPKDRTLTRLRLVGVDAAK